MSITISDEVLEAIGMSETDLIREIAIILFQENKISIGRASRLAGMNLLDFRRLLASRQISIGYGMAEFNEDLKTLEEMESE